MAERSLEPDFPDSLEAHNNSRYAHITRNLRGEPPMPVDTDRLSVLLFLRNISQGAAEKAVTDAFKNDTRSLDLYDFGESQKIIVGNNEALQLLTDYDWVIRLASNLSKGFEIQDLYQSLPTDWNWVYRQLQAIFNLPADERNQKRLNHATVEWAARWIMVRCRYMQNIIRADWKTRDWYGSDRYSFSGSYLAHTPDLLFDSLIPAYTKSPFVPPRAVAIETRGPETWSDNINVIYEHTYQWRRDDVRDLDNIINGGAVPQNTVDIFQWLVDYHNRYLLWRRTVLEICRRYRWTEIRILQRWLYRVDAGFQEFLVYFRRLLKHQRRYSGLKQSTWIKTRFCILHVNALVRFCKINYVQPVDDDYHRSIGSPAHFPNFHLSIYGDAVQDGRHNFPRLQPEARQPNDPDPPGFRARLPGAREGAAGPRMTGGLRGVAGIGGFGGLNGSRVVLDHDFSDVDSDPEDSRRPPNYFRNQPPLLPRFAEEEADTDDEGRPTDGRPSGPGNGGDGGGNNGGRPWWDAGFDDTGGPGPSDTYIAERGYDTERYRAHGSYFQDRGQPNGEEWEEMEWDISGAFADMSDLEWNDWEPEDQEGRSDGDELKLQNPRERSLENEKKMEIAEELRAEVEYETTMDALDGPTRADRISPVFLSPNPNPKYHLRVVTRDDGHMPTDSGVEVVVRAEMDQSLMMVADELLQAIMTRNGRAISGARRSKNKRNTGRGIKKRRAIDTGIVRPVTVVAA